MKKKHGYSLLSLFVVLALVFTTISTTAFAAESSDADKHAQQVISGLYPNDGLVTSDDGLINMKQSVKPLENETEFEVTLDVNAADSIQYEARNKSDVVLVLDTSNSMTSHNDANGISLDYFKKAATDFVEQYYAADKTNTNRLAVVTFQTTVDKVNDAPISYTAQDKDKVLEIIQGLKFEPSSSGGGIERSAIIDPDTPEKPSTPTESTLLQGGLHKAKRFFEENPPLNGQDQSIVVLTDGAANTSYQAGSATKQDNIFDSTYQVTQNGQLVTKVYEGGDYLLSDFDYTKVVNKKTLEKIDLDDGSTLAPNTSNNSVMAATQSEAYTIKQEGIEIYSVLIGGDSPDAQALCRYMVSSPENFYISKPGADLVIKFDNIVKEIITRQQNLRVSIPMAQYINFAGLDTVSNTSGVTFDNNTKTLVWDMGAEGVNVTRDGNSNVYQLKYRIKLDTAAKDFVSDTGYYINNTTNSLLQYRNGTVLKKVAFKVPQVQGYLGSFSFHKVAKDDTTLPLAGAGFKVTNENGFYKSFTSSGNQDTLGLVNITGIPVGTYTLKETYAPSGYIADKKDYTLKVSYGQIVCDEIDCVFPNATRYATFKYVYIDNGIVVDKKSDTPIKWPPPFGPGETAMTFLQDRIDENARNTFMPGKLSKADEDVNGNYIYEITYNKASTLVNYTYIVDGTIIDTQSKSLDKVATNDEVQQLATENEFQYDYDTVSVNGPWEDANYSNVYQVVYSKTTPVAPPTPPAPGATVVVRHIYPDNMDKDNNQLYVDAKGPDSFNTQTDDWATMNGAYNFFVSPNQVKYTTSSAGIPYDEAGVTVLPITYSQQEKTTKVLHVYPGLGMKEENYTGANQPTLDALKADGNVYLKMSFDNDNTFDKFNVSAVANSDPNTDMFMIVYTRDKQPTVVVKYIYMVDGEEVALETELPVLLTDDFDINAIATENKYQYEYDTYTVDESALNKDVGLFTITYFFNSNKEPENPDNPENPEDPEGPGNLEDPDQGGTGGGTVQPDDDGDVDSDDNGSNGAGDNENNNTNSPNTGDSRTIGYILMAVLFTSMCAIIVTIRKRIKSK